MTYTTRDLFNTLASVGCETEEQKTWIVEAFEKIAKAMIPNESDYKGGEDILFVVAMRIYRDLGHKEFDVGKYLEICKNNVDIEAYTEIVNPFVEKSFYGEVYIASFITESMLKIFKDKEGHVALSADDFKVFIQERLKDKVDD